VVGYVGNEGICNCGLSVNDYSCIECSFLYGNL